MNEIDIKIRDAKVKDSSAVIKLVGSYAKTGIMLEIDKEFFFENISNFKIAVYGKHIIGCAALIIFNKELGELRSLAVDKKYLKLGTGKYLTEEIEKKSKELGIKKLFILTYKDNYFSSLGYKKVKFNSFPPKIWKYCSKCPKFPKCDEVAMQKNI